MVSALWALLFSFAGARTAQSAQIGLYPEIQYPPSMLTPLPGFDRPAVFSISERDWYFPDFGRKKPSRVIVSGSSWSRNTLTLSQAYFKKEPYLPVTVNAREFSSWRSEEEKRSMIRRSKERQMAAAREGGRAGLKVSIPIKSKAVESLFGEGGAGLEVSGMRRISFAGNSSWTDGVNTRVGSNSKFPSLQMDQTYQFNITGTIGSKIFVKVNQDSRVNVPLANRLELRFKGSEDDVIKSIEAGNTTLSLPGAQMLRYSSQVRGLFGIKTEAQIGPFKFTGIASQEKANTERASIEAGARPLSDTLRDFEFLPNKIFDLGLAEHFESPDDSIIDFQLYRSAQSSSTETNNLRAKMYLDPRPVSQSDPTPRDTSEADLNTSTPGEEVEMLDPLDYTLYSRQRTLIIERRSLVTRNQALGIWLKMRRPNGSTYEIGDLTSNPFYVLKLIKSSRVSEGDVTDGYAWKNVYSIPRNLGIDKEDPDIGSLELKVYKGNYGDEAAESNLDNQNGVEYIQILGIDQVGSGSSNPDGKADFETLFADFEREIIILPSRFPFNTDDTYSNSDTLEERVGGIYIPNRANDEIRNDSKYYFVFESKVRSNTIRLGGANIVDGSEVVRANGETLVRGQDYRMLGNSIELTSERATDPGANIVVDYEVAPLFTVEKKTLLGASLQYERSRDFKLGITALFKSDKATTRKPKIGQETSRMFAYDATGTLTLRPNFLTGLVDALPGVRAKGPSRLSLSGELARSHPNPNVDGEAFVDDFEGTRQESSLGLNRGRWHRSSRPAQVDRHTTNRASMFWFRPSIALPTTEVYDIEVTTATSSIWPLNVVVEPREYKIDSFVVPDFLYNDVVDTIIDTVTFDTTFINRVDTVLQGSPDTLIFDESLAPVARERIILRKNPLQFSQEENWAGMTALFTGGDKNQSDAELFEMRLRVRQADDPLWADVRKGRNYGYMHIDFGEVSEDVIPNGHLDQEGGALNRSYDEEFLEDVGLDNMTRADEDAWFADILSDPEAELFIRDINDPSDDDFPYGEGATIVTNPYPLTYTGATVTNFPAELRKINGTENNHNDPELLDVDSEDIDYGKSTDLANDYFSYKINLDTAALENNFFVFGSEKCPNGECDSLADDYWITVRIPIQDPKLVDTIIGSPDWTNIRSVRIWFDSLIDTTMVEIAEMGLVSSNWEHRLVLEDPLDSLNQKSIFSLSVVSTSEDQVYTPPPGVTGSIDQINNITEPEQSLRLNYESFIHGDTGLVYRTQSAANYMGYGQLRMFVHGDVTLSPTNQLDYFFRLGSDSLNFYEFRTALEPDWSANNEVVMDFNELTALKDLGLKEELIDTVTGKLDTGERDPRYRVVGSPTLRSVRYFATGIVNPDPADTIDGINGEVWLDELRLTDVRNDAGTALRASASGNIGDFITSYSASVSYRDAFYRDIARGARGGSSNSLGSGRSDLSYSFSVSVGGERFFPPSLGLSLPLRFSYAKTITTPLLVTAGNSDIILPEARRIEERTISESRSFSVRESFKKKTRNPLFTVLLNPLSTNLSYSRSKSTSPTVPSSISENYSANAAYNLQTLPTVPGVPVFFMFSKVPGLKRLSETRLNLMPQTFGVKSAFSRNLNLTVNNAQGSLTSRYTRTLNSDLRTSIRWLSVFNSNFSANVRSDLRDPEWVNLSFSDFRLGKVMRFQQSLNHDYSPKSFGFVTHKVTFSSSYSENRKLNVVDLTASPADTALEPLEVSQNLRFALSGSFDLQKFLGGEGKKRDVRSRASADLAAKARAAQARAQGDTAKADSITREYEDKKETGPVGPWFGARVYEFSRTTLRKLTSFIDPFSGTFDRTQTRSANGLRYRPGGGFRFGFTDQFDVPIAPLRTRQQNNFSQTRGWRAGSGVKLFRGGITSKVELSESRSTSYPSVGSANRSVDRTWPRLSISIRPIRGLDNIWGINKLQGLLNSFIQRFSPKTSYSRRVSERYDLTNNITTSKNSSVDRAPLLSVTIPLHRQINVTASYETGTKTIETFNSSSGALMNARRDKSNSLRLSTQYSFRAPKGLKLPIFGRVKINSNVSMKLDVLKRFIQSESSGDGELFDLNSKRESFTVNYNTTYSFSAQLRGGMQASWTDTKILNRPSTHSRELRFYIEMRF